MLNNALTLIANGIPVFPCSPDDKRPLIRNGFKGASVDENQVLEWWGKWPDAWVGTPTGAIVALDLDAKHQFGLVRQFEQAAEDAGIDLSGLPKQFTPTGGGVHYLFRTEEEIRNRTYARNANGDTIIETRGNGGYIIAYNVDAIIQGPMLSDAQIGALLRLAESFCKIGKKASAQSDFPTKRHVSETNFGNTNGDSPGDQYNQRGDVFAVLKKHGWTRSGKHGWTRPGKDHGISATWDKVPGKFYVFSSNAFPFEPNESYSPFAVYATLECGGDFQEAASRLREEGYGEELRADPEAKAIADAVIANHEERSETAITASEEEPNIIVREHADRLRDLRNPPPEIIQGLIGVGNLVCLVALPKQGKTLVSLATAESVASGDPLGEREVKMPGRVLYLCTDAPASTERRMLALTDAAKHNVSSVPEFPPLPGGIKELSQILEAAKSNPYRLVVLDTWDSTRDHAGGSWADQDGVIEMVMRGLRKLAREYEIGILIVHHATRSDGGRTRGSVVFDARMDAMGLVEQKDGIISLSVLWSRDHEASIVGRWEIEAIDLWNDGNEVPRLAPVETGKASMPESHLAVLKAVYQGADSHSSIAQKSKLSRGSLPKIIKKLREECLMEMESYTLTPEGREVEEIRLQIMVDQVIRNGGF